MGRTRRNCPVFGCGSTNLARLANHLDQVHGMDTEERKKWLKWSKLGICVPRQDEEPKEFNMEESVETLLKRQEEMERKFNVYLQATKLKTVQSSKRKNSNPDEDRNKWLTFQLVCWYMRRFVYNHQRRKEV